MKHGDDTVALSSVVVPLLRGVVYREGRADTWQALLVLQNQVRDYVKVLGLELLLDEAEGYAFLRSIDIEQEEANQPRLMTRRPLSYGVSLLLALLRLKMVEADAQGGDPRLVLSTNEIVELAKLYHASGSNEVKLQERVERDVKRVVELGFLRKMKGREGLFEVRRILKAFVDAQWLNGLEEQLAEYRRHVEE